MAISNLDVPMLSYDDSDYKNKNAKLTDVSFKNTEDKCTLCDENNEIISNENYTNDSFHVASNTKRLNLAKQSTSVVKINPDPIYTLVNNKSFSHVKYNRLNSDENFSYNSNHRSNSQPPQGYCLEAINHCTPLSKNNPIKRRINNRLIQNNSITTPEILKVHLHSLLQTVVYSVLVITIFLFMCMLMKDVFAKTAYHNIELQEEAEYCRREFERNYCDSMQRAPALELSCREWQKCSHTSMHNTKSSKRAVLLIETFGQVLNVFFEQFSWKTICSLGVFTTFIWVLCFVLISGHKWLLFSSHSKIYLKPNNKQLFRS